MNLRMGIYAICDLSAVRGRRTGYLPATGACWLDTENRY
jgi:hypothetical protein